jgi:hypothetical protein
LIGKRLKSVMPVRNQLTGYCECTFSQGRLTSVFVAARARTEDLDDANVIDGCA